MAVERHSLVPLDGRAYNLDERQGNLGVPLLRRLEDEVVERLADLCERKRRVSDLLGLSVCSGEHLRPLTGVLAVVRVCSLSLGRRQRHTNKRVSCTHGTSGVCVWRG